MRLKNIQNCVFYPQLGPQVNSKAALYIFLKRELTYLFRQEFCTLWPNFDAQIHFFEITLKRNRFEIPSSRWDISCYSSNFNYFIHSILFISCHLHCYWLVNEGSPDWSNDPNGHLRFTWRFGIWFYLVQIKCSYFYQFSQRKSSNFIVTSSWPYQYAIMTS